jgi:hypothetical protein
MTHGELVYDRMIQMVLDGWEPIASGSGEYLYWRKGDSYDHPNPYPPFCGSKAAVIVRSLRFLEDVKEAKRRANDGQHQPASES